MRRSLLLAAAVACSGKGARPDAAPAAPPPAEIFVDARTGDDRSAEELERTVVIPLERALAGQGGVKAIDSVAIRGRGSVRLQLAPNADPTSVRMAIADRIQHADLPAGVQPELAPYVDRRAVARFALESSSVPLAEIRQEMDWELGAKLLEMPGVAGVAICGWTAREIHLDVDPARSAAFKIGVAAIENALGASGHDWQHREEIGKAVVGNVNGTAVHIEDIALVREAGAPPTCLAAYQGRMVIEGIVYTRPDVKVDASAVLAQLEKELPAGVRLSRIPADLVPISVAVPPETTFETRLSLGAKAGRATLLEVGRPEGAPLDATAGDLMLYAAEDEVAPLLERLRAFRGTVARRAHGIEIALGGADLEALAGAAATVRAALGKVDGIRSIAVLGAQNVPEVAMEPDTARIAELGVDASALRATLAALRGGLEAGMLADGKHRVPIKILFRDGSQPEVERLQTTMVAAKDAMVPLGEIMKLTAKPSPAMILRRGGVRAVLLEVETDQKQDALDAAKKVALPAGVRLLD